ncbi:ABC transporter substrate-binding protein [Nocardioides sp. NPDC057772]|uniref:ABC transporter substrate-binding protein n=1 Tax=Nocardioides sp. NPDC057772 TaxID=3346245 RepID=UPI00366F2A9F
MLKKRARYVAASAAGVLGLSLGLAACGSGGGEGSSAKPLTLVSEDAIEHLDPQRIYVGADIAATTRLVYRQLLAFPASTDPEVSGTPVPDLATDEGTSTEGGKVWSFTVKDGVKWEDGSDITCEDFAYGASRNFAADELTGGPGFYLTQKLALKGEYPGPYTATPEQQADFDQAVSCDGKTITYKFNSPWPDFPLAIASLHMMDPYKKSFDKGAKNDDVIFSNGPYKVEKWNATKGGTLVRNEHYDPETDSKDLREALPEKIEFKYGEKAATLYEKLFSDSPDSQYTVAKQSRVPPEFYPRLNEAGVKDRYVQVESPYVDYLVPNQNQMKDPKVRRALALATNINAWIAAGGGEKAYTPADSIVNPAVGGYKPNPSFEGRNLDGDVEGAKKLLAEAGVKTPYPITFAYPQSDTADKQAAALVETWEKAGFKVTLDPLGDVYYSEIQKPSNKADVMWGGWGADWPSAMTVTAALFDSRQIEKNTNGQNYGNYKNPEVDALFDKAGSAATIEEQNTFLQEADAKLGEDTAYIPLEIAIFNWVHGSKVKNFTTTSASNSFPELAGIDVED